MPNMYQEYLDNFNEHSKKFGQKVAIFLMVGIFYEMYDVMDPETGRGRTSFNTLVDLLGLKVSVKKGEGPGGLDGLVAGIPDYTVHKWAARLTQMGWTVVLVEQVKNIQGKVVKRTTDRILTPGTHIEAATSDDLYLTFVSLTEGQGQECQDAPYISTVALDLTTGHLHVFDTKAQGTKEAWTSNDIVQFMELYPPREVLWSTTGSTKFADITETKIKSILGCPLGTTFHRRDALTSGAWTKPDFRESFLKEQCSLKSLLPTHVALHLAAGSRTETALLSLLYSLKDLWPSMKLGQLLVYPWVPGTTMRLGENALVQLHMIVQDSNGTKQDVLSLVDKTASPMGHRGLRERLLKPSADPQHIRANLDAVEEWTKKEYDPIVRRLRTMTDVDRLYRKIQQGQLQSTDLIAFDTTFKAMKWIPNGPNEIQLIYEQVFQIFNADKVYAASEDTSLFHSGLCQDLDHLEQQIKEQWQKLNTWIEQVAKSANVAADTFKIEFRESSLVVKGPRGIIQTLNASGKLPQGCIAKLNKTGSHLESSELDQLYVILMRLRDTLKKKQAVQLVEHGSKLADQIFEQWILVADWITKLDVNISLARVAKEYGYSKPIIQDGSESSIEIQGLRHPLLEAQDKKIPYVQHNVSLTPKQSWLLYGLNASGKSSLMRAVGLATLLAQGGSFVPCSNMTLVPFQSLHTRIINTDNLWMGLSSFAVEMSEMRDIFREAGPKSLVLGDELCSGTETTSATALVAAGLKGLIKRGSRFLFATHLHGLSKIKEVSDDPKLKIWHLHVEYDHILDKLVYHRSLREGSGSSLYGLEVAKAMRIPNDILEDAIRFRKSLAGETELSESVGSSWNSNLIRIKCEKCGSSESKGLEVHHIKARHHASNMGHLSDLSNVHSKANLVVLCDKCHDDEHVEATVGPLIQTSDGMERSVLTSSSLTKEEKKSKWSEEQMDEIRASYTKFPKLSMPALAKYLLNQHSIQISVPTLKKLLA
uniref:DNA mismatch repair proteins mutS family domain-containing protein n=1 Tax=viral metagenome TaxID=1070528 RepID=A0A6C0DKA0_9ZZZZ